jgi:hypothetical protein
VQGTLTPKLSNMPGTQQETGLAMRPVLPTRASSEISGDPNRTCSEPPSLEVEQFLALLRLENRGKLAELPQHLMEVHNDFTSPS